MCSGQFTNRFHSGSFLIAETRNGHQEMLELSAELAMHGGGTILDGGNCFNAYQVAHAVRLKTSALPARLETIRVARAFNCHQMLSLCQHVPFNARPCQVLDLLETFEDDNVPLPERMRLLRLCLEQLSRVQRQAAIIVSIAPPKAEPVQWESLAALVRRKATDFLEEGFMGKTIPTISQIAQQAETILSRFSRVLQPEERQALEDLFVKARCHIAAISEANYLLPFEVAQQAMLLEQQKEIIELRAQLEALKKRLENN